MHLIKEMDVLQAVNMYLYEPLVCQGEEDRQHGEYHV